MAKVETGDIYELNLDNTSYNFMDLAHKERAYKNCHKQFARVIALEKSPIVKMMSGPSKNKQMKVNIDWFREKRNKIPCDCLFQVVLNRGCQNTGIHE